ncbi:MAG: hypothetical protein ACLR8Y_00820 [Alistipes indistinctus]
MDITHSAAAAQHDQRSHRGLPSMIETIARASVAVGTDGLFIETHPNPAEAKSDGANMLPLDRLKDCFTRLCRIRETINAF